MFSPFLRLALGGLLSYEAVAVAHTTGVLDKGESDGLAEADAYRLFKAYPLVFWHHVVVSELYDDVTRVQQRLAGRTWFFSIAPENPPRLVCLPLFVMPRPAEGFWPSTLAGAALYDLMHLVD